MQIVYAMYSKSVPRYLLIPKDSECLKCMTACVDLCCGYTALASCRSVTSFFVFQSWQVLSDRGGHTCSACRRQRPALPALPLPNSHQRMGTSLIQLLWTCVLFYIFFAFSEWELRQNPTLTIPGAYLSESKYSLQGSLVSLQLSLELWERSAKAYTDEYSKYKEFKIHKTTNYKQVIRFNNKQLEPLYCTVSTSSLATTSACCW